MKLTPADEVFVKAWKDAEDVQENLNDEDIQVDRKMVNQMAMIMAQHRLKQQRRMINLYKQADSMPEDDGVGMV